VPGCEVTWGLEIDHTTEYALSRVTTLDDLAFACSHHHLERTHRGARLTGPPGDRVWHAPDGSIIRDRPPPGNRPAPPGGTDRDPSPEPGQRPLERSLFGDPELV
jgi:hypothetical protein